MLRLVLCVFCRDRRLHAHIKTHVNSPGTSIFTHNNCEMSVNLLSLLYFYCRSGIVVNAVLSGPACFPARWPSICLHSAPFLWCIFTLICVCVCVCERVWKSVGVCFCLCTDTCVRVWAPSCFCTFPGLCDTLRYCVCLYSTCTTRWVLWPASPCIQTQALKNTFHLTLYTANV